MKQANIIKLFNITRQTWTNWKKEKKPIVFLIEKYFTDKDIEEFIKTGKCTKFDSIFFEEDQMLSSTAIANSIRGELYQKKKTERNYFEAPVVLLYRIFESQESNINKDFNKENLINLIDSYYIKFSGDFIPNMITKKDKQSAINFINELDSVQINWIINNTEEFLQILWEERNFFNSYLDADFFKKYFKDNSK